MKQYESFVISQWNVQGLNSPAFGLKSNNSEFTDELKKSDIIILMERWDRGDLPTGCPPRYGELTVNLRKLPGVTQGRNSRRIHIWFKADTQILQITLNLLQKVKIIYG